MLLVAADPDHDRHDPGAGHPEAPSRLAAALAGITDAGLADAVVPVQPRLASLEELARAHDPAYLDDLVAWDRAGGARIDADTSMSAGSWETARRTAGLALAAVEALQPGPAEGAGPGGPAKGAGPAIGAAPAKGAASAAATFVLGRPPGHHATRGQAMGFCLVNHVAVAAAALVERGERVVVVDWDVHHGNGTQNIFWDDPRVLYVSVHQSPLYPGTGRLDERGGPSAQGATINLPLPPGCTGDTYLALMDEVVAPAVEHFAPGWVLVSAGFDAHRADPLAQMSLSAGDYADLAGRMVSLAGRTGRTVAFLEGGYQLSALRDSVGACAAALLGRDYRPEPATSGGAGSDRAGRDLVARYRSFFGG